MQIVKSKEENTLFFSPKSIETLVQELKCMYYAERHQVKLLQRLEKRASTKYLRACFHGHYIATLRHVAALQDIFSLLNRRPASKKSAIVDEFIEEAKVNFRTSGKRSAERDLGLIYIAEKIEVFEIKKYNELVGLANDLGNFKLIFFLEEILIEENEALETFAAVREDTLSDERLKTLDEKGSETDEPEIEEAEAIVGGV